MPLFCQSQFMIFSHYFLVHCTIPDREASRSFMIQSQFHDPVAVSWSSTFGSYTWSCTQFSTVSYRLCVAIRNFYVEMSQCTVYCTMRIKGVITLKNHERQRRNKWSLTRCLSMLVASQVPMFFAFSIRCKFLARNIGFKIPTWSRKASPGRRTWGGKKQSFSLHFWRSRTSTG